MVEVVVALIGVAGLLFPVLFGNRIGMWKTVHEIQELGAAHSAVPVNMTDERDVIEHEIKVCIADIKRRREGEGGSGALYFWLLGIAWFCIFAASLGLSVTQEGADPSQEFWQAARPSVQAASYAAFFVALASITLLVLWGITSIAARFRGTAPIALWLMAKFLLPRENRAAMHNAYIGYRAANREIREHRRGRRTNSGPEDLPQDR